MSNKTDNLLEEFAQRMLTALDKGVDMASQEIPILLHEILYWGFAKSVIPFLLSVAVMATCIYWVVRLVNEQKSNWKIAKQELENSTSFWLLDCDTYYFVRDGGNAVLRAKGDGFLHGFRYVALIVTALLAFMFLVMNFDWLKILLAPRLYLLEYASSLL